MHTCNARKVGVIAFLAAIALALSVVWMGPVESSLAQRQSITFSGHVYVANSITPLTGVTVELYTSPAGRNTFGLVATTTTDGNGAFSFFRAYTTNTDYRVKEVNPLLYTSTGAIAPGGAVLDNDTVLYRAASAGTHSGIVFYDKVTIIIRATSTPTNTPIQRATSTNTPVGRPTSTNTPVGRATSTPTNTPARRPTSTPTPGRLVTSTPSPTLVTTDLFVKDLEVTQSIQDLNDSVGLIAGKRTVVRAHVRANDGNHSNVLGEFRFARAGTLTGWLKAENSSGGRIKVREFPGRGLRDNSYFIEVPPSMLGPGVLSIIFRMNDDQTVPETSYSNNGLFKAVTFESSSPMKIKIFNVKYQEGGQWRAASIQDILALVSWLRRAYPVATVDWHLSTLIWGYNHAPGEKSGDCERVNALLFQQWLLDGWPYPRRYYGLVTDTGSWMRGCSGGIPSVVASGPTGMGTWGWDNDGSYGDWYGAHELGHAYGRKHVDCAGNEAGTDGNYPYPGGKIGMPFDGSTFYGWDTQLDQVYPPFWSDIMSYCSWQWISDYTYNAIRNRLNAEGGGGDRLAVLTREGETLSVFGLANLTQGTAELSTFYRMTVDGVPETPTPSDDWNLILYDAAGVVLAEHPFTPKVDEEAEEGEERIALIQETVPWVDGTARIVVEYQGSEVASRSVSATAPTVRVISPNGGEVLSGAETMVRWKGKDDDDDDLVYAIQYSPDAGATWETVAVELTASPFAVPLDVLPGSETALFRVIVSDGVHSGEDESDGIFQVESKPPLAHISSPRHLASYTSGQQIVMEGEGFDTEDGILGDDALSWSSDLQGELGTGQLLAVTDLQTGAHTITLQVMDSDGSSASATVLIYVDVPLLQFELPLVIKT